MPRFSANLGFLWADLPLLDRLDAAARAGFRAVELHFPYDTAPERVRERCGRLGLALLGVNTPRGSRSGDAGLAAVPGREAEARALIDQAFAWAATAGACSVHVMAGIVTPEDRAAGRETLLATLAYADAKAAGDGLTILLEPLNARDMPGYFYSRVEDAVEVIDTLASPRVRLMFDCYHVAVAQGDVVPRLQKCMSSIGHIQIAGAPSRHEPDDSELDYRAVFDALDRLGYAGWVGCEYRPRTTPEDGFGWIGAFGLSLRSSC